MSFELGVIFGGCIMLFLWCVDEREVYRVFFTTVWLFVTCACWLVLEG